MVLVLHHVLCSAVPACLRLNVRSDVARTILRLQQPQELHHNAIRMMLNSWQYV
jgi:hypothetical protein